jgi:hypothetical protein
MLWQQADSWTWFFRAVSVCYERPEAVIRRMNNYRLANGESAFIAKLSDHPGYFGRRFLVNRKNRNSRRLREAKKASALLSVLAADAINAEANGLTVAAQAAGRASIRFERVASEESGAANRAKLAEVE